MSSNLALTVIIFAFILLIVIINLLKKGRIPIKYAIVWIFAVIFMIFVSFVPKLMENIAKILGFELLSNMVICLFVAMLIFLTIILTVMIAGQKKKTTLLIQEVSMLKKELEDLK